MGDKVSAIKVMKASGVPCVPGSDGPLGSDADENFRIAKDIGYPLIIKASGGGGARHAGRAFRRRALELDQRHAIRGARCVWKPPSLHGEIPRAAAAYRVPGAGDNHGNVVHLGERDCLMQRRHQKVLEEAPAPGSRRSSGGHGRALVRACHEVGYRNAGTLEFLYQDNEFYFIEMNTRMQVEHPVTELVTGIDIVKAQLSSPRARPC